MMENGNKLTAVDKLYINLLGIVSFDSEKLRNLYEISFNKAKAMEKEHIQLAKKESYDEGWLEATQYIFKKYKQEIEKL